MIDKMRVPRTIHASNVGLTCANAKPARNFVPLETSMQEMMNTGVSIQYNFLSVMCKTNVIKMRK